jgi:hypothetical protein
MEALYGVVGRKHNLAMRGGSEAETGKSDY